jgi:hypothetical protein
MKTTNKEHKPNSTEVNSPPSPAIIFVEGGLAEVVHGHALIIDFDGLEEPTEADLEICRKNIELAEQAEADQWVIDVLQLNYDNAKQNVVD